MGKKNGQGALYLAINHFRLGQLYSSQGKLVDANQEFSAVQELLATASDWNTDPTLLLLVLESSMGSADLLAKLGRFDQAIIQYAAASSRIERAHKAVPSEDFRLHRATVAIRIGEIQAYAGRLSEASEQLSFAAESLDYDFLDDRLRPRIALAKAQLARLQGFMKLLRGDSDGAMEVGRVCEQDLEALIELDPENSDLALEMINAIELRAWAQYRMGPESEAEQVFSQLAKSVDKAQGLLGGGLETSAALAWLNLTYPFEKLQNQDTIAIFAREARQSSNHSFRVSQTLALAEIHAGRDADALELLDVLGVTLTENEEYPDRLSPILRLVALLAEGKAEKAERELSEISSEIRNRESLPPDWKFLIDKAETQLKGREN